MYRILYVVTLCTDYPRSRCISTDGVYRILYEEVDETHVEVLYLHTAHEGSAPEAIRSAATRA